MQCLEQEVVHEAVEVEYYPKETRSLKGVNKKQNDSIVYVIWNDSVNGTHSVSSVRSKIPVEDRNRKRSIVFLRG